MAQKPMLRAEVYAHAMRASQNRKKEVRREKNRSSLVSNIIGQRAHRWKQHRQLSGEADEF